MLQSQFVHRLDGIDGSHWQPDAGPMDLAVTRQTTDWIAWKATQGTGAIDRTFTSVRAQITALKFRHRLYYHWLTPAGVPLRQAYHYQGVVGRLAPGEGVMLDAEEPGITEQMCLDWLEAVEASTLRPSSVYTGLFVSGGTIWRSPRIRQSKFGPRPMHLAAYSSPSKLWPRLTAAGGHEVHAWQWSSDGPAPGITGRCDLNLILDPAIYDLCCGVIKPVPVPPVVADPVEDAMPIVTNAEQFFDAAPGVAKFVLQDSGRLRLLDGVEWETRGSAGGTPWSNADIGRHGVDS